MSNVATLVGCSEHDPEFKFALRNATLAELKEAMKELGNDTKNSRKMGRFRAALRRAERRTTDLQ